MKPRTLFDKVWASHVVQRLPDGPELLYVDLHLVHEVTSPQAFEGLRLAGRRVRRRDLTVATMDHNVPTLDGPITDPLAKAQLEALRANCEEFGVALHATGSGREGIVHVIGPEVEHVLATQTLAQRRPKTMKIEFVGELPAGLTAKDMILGAIGQVGVDGGVGYAVEYAGEAVERLSMEGRMTICNMSIEWGARAGMIAPDETTFAYLQGRPFAPTDWDAAVERWRELRSDPDAEFDRVVEVDLAALEPQVTWGTNPGMVVPIGGVVPDPDDFDNPDDRAAAERALQYMGLRAGTPMQEIAIDRVFIGSCTNSRIEDLRAAAALVDGKRVHPSVTALVVPGSAAIRRQAEAEGLHEIFLAAGFEWRRAGCSMCLGMNPDILQPGERCASTSNRNFEGRQGAGGRTHLVSPQVAAATAIAGHIADARELVPA